MRKNFRKNESGRTIIAFVLGVIVGLGLAVVAAILINRNAPPVSKTEHTVIQRKPARINSPIADPNKPLHGNDSAGSNQQNANSPNDSEQNSEKVADTNIDKNAGVKVDARAAERAEAYEKSEAKPETKQETKQEAKQETKSEKTKTGATDYYLQTNAFRNSRDAEEERGRLALAGFEAQVSVVMRQGMHLYCVQMGPYPDEDIAQNMKDKLKNHRIYATIVRVSR